MARSFGITTATTELVLDKGQGEVTFTVSNLATRPVRGRARLEPLGGAQETWLSVTGDFERDFKTNDTQQLGVRVVTPAGAPPGKYSFRLDMVNVADPTEDYTNGPTVAFEVYASKAPPKPFPVWVFPIAAALLVLVAIGLWLIFRPGNSSTTEFEADKLNPGESLEADFEADKREGDAPLVVTFTYKSKFKTSSWDWEFGDGGDPSIAPAPVRVFKLPGKYDVTLRAGGPLGEVTVPKKEYISVKLATPTLLYPGPSEQLPLGTPPVPKQVVLRWDHVPAATRYLVTYSGSSPRRIPGGNPWQVPSTTIEAKVNTLAITLNNHGFGTWKWQVTAVSDSGIKSSPSEERSFRY